MTRPARLWIQLTSGLWLIPSVLVAGFVGAALGITALDRRVDAELVQQWSALLTTDAGSSRELLSSISGALITVAGVVFSITMVTLALASTQYSSRVLRAFTRDKANQVVLGMLVGTFAYCTTVLLTITGGEGSFVPSIAVFVGFVLAIAGVFALVFYIHRITTEIQSSSIIAAIARDTIAAIEQTFTGKLSKPVPRQPPEGEWYPVLSTQTGYIESVDLEALARFAKRRGAVVRMDHAAGDFVIQGKPLVSVRRDGGIEPSDAARLNRCHHVGRFRTVDQDPDFGIRQLADIAIRALSPGVNDTTTAVECVDHLSAILVRAARLLEQQDIAAADGRLCVVVKTPRFEWLVAKSFDQIRQNAPGNVAVITALLHALDVLAGSVTEPRRRQAVHRHLQALHELVHRSIESPYDLQSVHSHLKGVMERAGMRESDQIPTSN